VVDASHIPDATLKATALLIAMGRPLAQRLVAKLNEEELRLISRSAKTLPLMNRSVVEALVEEPIQRRMMKLAQF
jgi:flagellar motor switch protein FliG